MNFIANPDWYIPISYSFNYPNGPFIRVFLMGFVGVTKHTFESRIEEEKSAIADVRLYAKKNGIKLPRIPRKK